MNSDDDVRRFLDRMATEPGFGSVDPAPVLARAYRRLARTTSVLGLAGVTLVAAIVMVGPNLFQASPAPAPSVAAGTVATTRATTPHAARITCLGDGRSQLQATTVALQPDGLHVAIVQQHTGRRSQVFIRVSGWMMSVGFSSPDRAALPHGRRGCELRPHRGSRLARCVTRSACPTTATSPTPR